MFRRSYTFKIVQEIVGLLELVYERSARMSCVHYPLIHVLQILILWYLESIVPYR